MLFVSTVIIFAFCVFFAEGHNLISNWENQTPLRDARSVFVDCCIGRKFLCKHPSQTWVRNRPPRPRMIENTLVCDGKKDCPLGEDEDCVKCGNPPHVPFSFRLDNTTHFPVGAVVSYQCQSGFVTKDVNSVSCDVRGAWSKAPICERLCDVLPSVTDGSAGAGGPFTPGDIVIVSCNAGFLPLGNNFFTCAFDGSWSGKPSCVRQCGVLPRVPDGSVVAGGPFTPGDTVVVSCSVGFLPLRDNVFTCAADASWTGNPSCVRQCDPIPPVLFGDVVGTSVTPLVVGSVVSFSCNLGYAPKTNNVLRCDSGGAWSGTPQCDKVCPASVPNTGPFVQDALCPSPGSDQPVGAVVDCVCTGGDTELTFSNMKFVCDKTGSWVGNAICSDDG